MWQIEMDLHAPQKLLWLSAPDDIIGAQILKSHVIAVSTELRITTGTCNGLTKVTGKLWQQQLWKKAVGINDSTNIINGFRLTGLNWATG